MGQFKAKVGLLLMCLLSSPIYTQDLSGLSRPSLALNVLDGYHRVFMITTESFAGVSLSEFHEIPIQYALFSPMRYQPDPDDIQRAELILDNEIEKLCGEFHGKGSAIYRRLHRYVRQYVGLTNQTGDRLVLINGLWKNRVKNYPWESRFINILHGGDSFWRTRINLSRGEVELFLVNSDCH